MLPPYFSFKGNATTEKIAVQSLPSGSDVTCASLNITDLWKKAWNNAVADETRRINLKRFVSRPKGHDEFLKMKLKQILSCCESMENGCREIQGDCDHDMECQPGKSI